MAGVTTQTSIEDLADLSARLTHLFKPGFMEVLNDETTLWNLLPKNRGTGPLVEWKCHYGRNTGGGAVGETDSPGDAGSQASISLWANYAIYVKPVEISDFMIAKDALAGGTGARIWAEETARAAVDMKQDIEKHLWSAQSGNSCLGILDAIEANRKNRVKFPPEYEKYLYLLERRIINPSPEAVAYAEQVDAQTEGPVKRLVGLCAPATCSASSTPLTWKRTLALLKSAL